MNRTRMVYFRTRTTRNEDIPRRATSTPMDPLSATVLATLGIGSAQGIYRILRGDARRAMLPSMASIPAPDIDKSLQRTRGGLNRSVTLGAAPVQEPPEPAPVEEPEPIEEPEPVEEPEPAEEPEPEPLDLPSAPDLGDEEDVIGEEVEEVQEDLFAERLGREGAKTGEVQISLIWFNKNDLDLSVVCPSGERISFDNKISNCGGRLDIDMNESGKSDEPVENVFWEKDAPKGRYRVFVEHFEKHDSTDITEFSILVTVDGEPREFKGQISNKDPPQEVCFFDV
ncbi:MAG: hypothetical protein ACJZ59_01485 [Candidatus Thalassarchaeaceae archaeon]